MKKGGGVAILIHTSLSYFDCKDLNALYQDSFECIFIELRQKALKSIILGSLYRPPNLKPKEFIEQYKIMLHKAQLEKKS